MEMHLKALLVLGLLERDCTDEDGMLRSAVAVAHEETNTLELESIAGLCSSEDRIDEGLDDGLAVGVKIRLPIRKLIRTIRLEERLIETDLSSARLLISSRLGNPVDETFGLDGALKVVFADKLNNLALSVLHDILACHRVGIAQTDRLAGCKTPEVLLVLKLEVVAVDVDEFGELHGVGPTFLENRVVGTDDGDLLVGSNVAELDEKRLKNTHSAVATDLHILAANLLQNSVVDEDSSIGGDTDDVTEVVDSIGRVTTTTETVKSGHARIVPAVDKLLGHKGQQLALAHDSASDVKAAELPHNGAIDLESIKKPVVRGTTDEELQSAQRQIDILEAVVQAVSEVVAGVDAVLVASHGVRDVADTIGDKIPHARIVGGDVHLHTKSSLTLLEATLTHLLEELKALLDGAITPRAGSLDLTALGDLLAGLVAHVSLSTLDQFNGARRQLVKV